MKYVAISLVVSALVLGCSSDTESDASTGAETQAPVAEEKSSRPDPKWSISIAGYPEKSGSIIVAATMDGNGNYTLSRRGFRASLDFRMDDPTSRMMISFEKEDIRCVNQKGARAMPDGDRAIISGEVMCYPKSGNIDDAEPAAISGYFELKK